MVHPMPDNAIPNEFASDDSINSLLAELANIVSEATELPTDMPDDTEQREEEA